MRREIGDAMRYSLLSLRGLMLRPPNPSLADPLFTPLHNDVIKWKHFPRYWPFVRGIPRSPVNSQQKGHWRGALVFSLICAWINVCVNNREAGDFRRCGAHYDVTVMLIHCILICWALMLWAAILLIVGTAPSGRFQRNDVIAFWNVCGLSCTLPALVLHHLCRQMRRYCSISRIIKRRFSPHNTRQPEPCIRWRSHSRHSN